MDGITTTTLSLSLLKKVAIKYAYNFTSNDFLVGGKHC